MATWRERWTVGTECEVHTSRGWQPARVTEVPTVGVTGRLSGRFRVQFLRPEGGEGEPSRSMDVRPRSRS